MTTAKCSVCGTVFHGVMAQENAYICTKLGHPTFKYAIDQVFPCTIENLQGVWEVVELIVMLKMSAHEMHREHVPAYRVRHANGTETVILEDDLKKALL